QGRRSVWLAGRRGAPARAASRRRHRADARGHRRYRSRVHRRHRPHREPAAHPAQSRRRAQLRGDAMTLPSLRDELIQLAVIQIGSEEYAIDIMRIKSIIQPLKITKVPKAPRFVEGVVELRGVILPIVDLRKRFDVAPGAMTRTTKYVIVSLGERLIGLVVDA